MIRTEIVAARETAQLLSAMSRLFSRKKLVDGSAVLSSSDESIAKTAARLAKFWAKAADEANAIFGNVSWCDDDIREALKHSGKGVTSDNVERIRGSHEARHIADYMIEDGWEILYGACADLPDHPKRSRKLQSAAPRSRRAVRR